jgi:putative transposase
MTTVRDPIYAGYRYPAEIISYAVWLYFRFPLSLRMVEEMLAARGISVTHETIRQWGLKFGREWEYQEFRAGLGMIGAKEPDDATPQRTSYS